MLSLNRLISIIIVSKDFLQIHGFLTLGFSFFIKSMTHIIQAQLVRKIILKMIFQSKSSHIGSALSMVDILSVLYS